MSDGKFTASNELPLGKVGWNTGAFAFCFAMWVMLGPSSRMIAEDLKIPLATATGLKAVPILLGSVLRVPVGILSDRLGARTVLPGVILISSLGALWLSWAQSATGLTLGALLMGLIGTSFAVGVQSVSSWTPPKRQGFALGIFGAGNIGTAITTFGMPFLLTSMTWRTTFRVYAAVLATVAVTYAVVMRNSPRLGAPPKLQTLLQPLKEACAWRLGFYYMATFGAFVATTLLISDIYVDGFSLALPVAGAFATTFTFTSSLARIPGGYLSDRFGPRRVLEVALLTVAVSLVLVALKVPLVVTAVLVVAAGLAMGAGMAATYKFVPDFYPDRVGAAGGIVGAIGGLAGFVLPWLCAPVGEWLGYPQAQVLPVAALAGAALIVQLATRRASVAVATS